MSNFGGKPKKTPKHGSCLAHPKLPCGCKVCETPLSTAHENLDELIAFHADIHTAQARHHAREVANRLLPATGGFVDILRYVPKDAAYVTTQEWNATADYRTMRVA